MQNLSLKGLIAATYTPMHADGRLNLPMIETMVERLIADGVDGFYICGSTGEGMSLSSSERRDVAEAYVGAAAKRVPVVVQVGHNAVTEAQELAAHAQQIGATAISANAPSYFKVQSADMLARCMAEIASGAPDLPFYYYHIPALTGVSVDMLDYLDRAAASTPTFAGVKYTMPTLDEYQELMAWDDGRLDVLWGCDEMLLPALAVGSQGAVGSTYNLFSPIYRQVLAAFEAGDLVTARAAQGKAIQVIRTIKRFPFHSAMKQIFTMRGIDCGPCRLPQPALSSDDVRDLRAALEALGLLENATVSASTSQE